MNEGSQQETPHRVQRKRTKGWKMPPNTVYVGRPTKWGNPYQVGEDGMASFSDILREYRHLMSFNVYRSQLDELRGKNLACWCPLDQPCHADILLELANA